MTATFRPGLTGIVLVISVSEFVMFLHSIQLGHTVYLYPNFQG